MEQEVHKIWLLVLELSDQITQNNRVANELRAQISELKAKAKDNKDGSTLRRFVTDLSQESFESELERSTCALILENQTLLHENKQLNGLSKEYEQTLETVMNKFRTHCTATAQHEETLTKHYEALLLARQSSSHPYPSNSAQSILQSYKDEDIQIALESLRTKIRCALRAMAGDPQPEIAEDRLNVQKLRREERKARELEEEHAAIQAGQLVTTSTNADPNVSAVKIQDSEKEDTGIEDLFEDLNLDDLPDDVDWATEREVRITELEAENQELRRRLGILPSEGGDWGIDAKSWENELPMNRLRASGGGLGGSKLGSSFGPGGRHGRGGSFDEGNGGLGGGGGGGGRGMGGGGEGGRMVMTPFGLGVTASNNTTNSNTGGGGGSGWLNSLGFGNRTQQQQQQQTQGLQNQQGIKGLGQQKSGLTGPRVGFLRPGGSG